VIKSLFPAEREYSTALAQSAAISQTFSASCRPALLRRSSIIYPLSPCPSSSSAHQRHAEASSSSSTSATILFDTTRNYPGRRNSIFRTAANNASYQSIRIPLLPGARPFCRGYCQRRGQSKLDSPPAPQNSASLEYTVEMNGSPKASTS